MIPALVFGMAIPCFALPDASTIGALPSSRNSVLLEPSDRNPYAKQQVPKIEVEEAVADVASEDSLITGVLNGLRVVGRSRSDAGWKVLVGDLILEVGKDLPALISGQTKTLRVVEITDERIEIEWVVPDSNETSKRSFIPVELNPSVAKALPGAGAGVPAVITRSAAPTPAPP